MAPSFDRKNSLQDRPLVSSTNVDMFGRYRTVLALVRTMSFYEVNLKSVLTSKLPDGMDMLLYRYLILMRALLKMEETEKERRAKNLKPVGVEQEAMVGEGVAFLKELFQSLIELREKLSAGILEVSKEPEVRHFA